MNCALAHNGLDMQNIRTIFLHMIIVIIQAHILDKFTS